MGSRELTETERELVLPALLEVGVAPEPVCRSAIRRCRLIRQMPSLFEIRGLKTVVAYMALRSRACGITLGADIFVRSEFFDHDETIPMQLLAHEVAHVAQFERDGVATFLTRYLVDYLTGLALGRGDRQAYRDIAYEQEARQVAEMAVEAKSVIG